MQVAGNTIRERGTAYEVGVGDYLSSPSQLWYVVSFTGDRAVVEDCATNELLSVPSNVLFALRRVRRA